MSQEIRIDDLNAPVLDDAQKAAIAWGESVTTVMSEASVLQEAMDRTGLGDFGPGGFRERLRLILDEWEGDTELTGLHRMVLRGYAVRWAANRLLIRDMFRRHPEIHDIRIEKPVIVVGLPRSGTTHLVNMLAADTRFRSLPLWEAYEPVPNPREPAEVEGVDPRYKRCADAWDQLRTASPLLAAMHPMEPDHIHEELELMGPDFASYNFEWLSPVPRWRDHYYSHDQTPHYEYLRDVLKLLTWVRGPRRWVLKCPQHLEQLGPLKAVFPDATVAVTHRDPVAVIQSAVTMMAYNQRTCRRHVDTKGLIAYWTDRVEHLLRACVRDRQLWPEAQSIDVPFHEFMADDMAMVERIYARAGMDVRAEARAQLQAYLDSNPRGKEGRVIYNLRRDFGVEPEAVRERFAFYFDRFPIKPEVK